MIYLFLGTDPLSKDTKLKQLKQEHLSKDTQDFNWDILYPKDFNLRGLQEKILFIPVKSKKRIIVIKQAHNLKDDIKEFILKYAKIARPEIILVLDMERYDPRDSFVSAITRFSQVCRFKEEPRLDAFGLGRLIEASRADFALRLLNQLLASGEKPERILGGLRYVWERDLAGSLKTKRRLKLLLNCDLEIKTGRLKPDFALEKLVVKLCSL